MACLQNYQKQLSFATFCRVYSNPKKVVPPSLIKKAFSPKTTCHSKPKLFLRTKLLKIVLLAKYLISIAATLRVNSLRMYVQIVYV